MKQRLSESGKRQLVARYQNGEAVCDLCAETGVGKTAMYEWIGLYEETVTETGQVVTPREFEFLRRRAEKLESLVAVLKSVDCTASSPLQEKLLALEKLYGQFSVHVLCEALDVPRGTFYNHISRNKRGNSTYAKRREELRVQIKDIFENSRQLFGANKVHAVLTEQGHPVSEKLVAELMREMGLYSIRTTAKQDHQRLVGYEKKANVLKQRFHADAPNQVWVSDVTCFRYKELWYYICVIIDIYSRTVVAHGIALKNSTRLITSTFKLACAQRQPGEGLVFHSDQGSQYTSYAFRKLLREHGVTQSFSNPGKPHDNAVAESFFASLKKEELYRTNYKSEAELRKCVDAYMLFYNDQRPHGTLHYKTPNQAEVEFEQKETSEQPE